MITWAIIPVKHLRESKRRLAHLLPAEDRAELILSFLDDLLAVLNATPGIDRVLVVTGDPVVSTLAGKYGADVLVELETVGLNAAVSIGVARAIGDGASVVLVLPADLPYVRVEDIQKALRPLDELPSPLIGISSDESGEGTNALLLAPPSHFTFHYGPGSFRAHLAEARNRSVWFIDAPGLRFDLDTESDWLTYNGDRQAAVGQSPETGSTPRRMQ
jgi:2-phospho-L-lactate guanylyltransferase